MQFYGDKFRKIRQLKKISVNDMSKLSNINRTTLWVWETGKRIPSEATIRVLAKVLNVDVREISDLKPLNELSIQQFSKPVQSLIKMADMNSVDRNEVISSLRKQLDLLDINLKNSSIIINAILSSLDTAFYIKSTDQKYVVANKAFLNMLGLNIKTNIIGKTDSQLFSASEAAVNYKQDIDVINTGNARLNLETYLPGTRKKRIGLISKIPIMDNLNKITGILGIFTDLTEQIKLRKKLVESEKKYRNFLENLSDIAYKTDEKGNVVYCNKITAEVLGVSRECILNNSFLPLFIEEDRDKSMEFHKVTMKKGKNLFDLTFTNGRTFQFKSEVRKDETGNIIGTFGIGRDITESRKNQELLLLLTNAVRSTPHAICINSFEADIIYLNPAYEKMFGYSLLEAKNMRISDFVPENLRERLNQEILVEFFEKGNWSGESKGLHKDGSEFPIFVSSSIIKDTEDSPIAIYTIFRDISEEKENKIINRFMINILNSLLRTFAWIAVVEDNKVSEYKFISDNIEKVTSYSKDEFINNKVFSDKKISFEYKKAYDQFVNSEKNDLYLKHNFKLKDNRVITMISRLFSENITSKKKIICGLHLYHPFISKNNPDYISGIDIPVNKL